MLNYLTATENHIYQLAQMRWDFRLEESPGATVHDHDTFITACAQFLRQGIADRRWTYWIAVDSEVVISHIYVQHVDKVPKPNRLVEALGYVTNVYTRPAYRGQGIGTQLMTQVLRWAHEQDFEGLIVWPSETSVNWYKRAGFQGDPEMLSYSVRPYVL